MKNISSVSLCAITWLALAQAANAAGAPILTGPGKAQAAQGWAEADKEREERRREKVKALTAFANEAASQGRELSDDEWSNIANDIIGSSGMLNGTAPSRAVVESIRLNANAKARRVAALREQEALDRRQRIQSNDANAGLANAPEATAMRAAYQAYARCVAGAAGRLLPNNQESAAAIAEAAEPDCTPQTMAVLAEIARVLGAPTSGAQADERYRIIRARVIKEVSAGIMQVRQEQAVEKSPAPTQAPIASLANASPPRPSVARPAHDLVKNEIRRKAMMMGWRVSDVSVDGWAPCDSAAPVTDTSCVTRRIVVRGEVAGTVFDHPSGPPQYRHFVLWKN